MPKTSCPNNPTEKSETARLRNSFFRVAGIDEALQRAWITARFPRVATRENIKFKTQKVNIKACWRWTSSAFSANFWLQSGWAMQRNFRVPSSNILPFRCYFLSASRYNRDFLIKTKIEIPYDLYSFNRNVISSLLMIKSWALLNFRLNSLFDHDMSHQLNVCVTTKAFSVCITERSEWHTASVWHEISADVYFEDRRIAVFAGEVRTQQSQVVGEKFGQEKHMIVAIVIEKLQFKH